MMELRPIVVDADWMVLGGNMRRRALIELGMEEIPGNWIRKYDDLSEEEKREFVIKDNASFGEWDWEGLITSWNVDEVVEWGVDGKLTKEEIEQMKSPVNAQTEHRFATELDASSNYIVLKFSRDIDFIYAKTLFGLETETSRRANGKPWSSGVGRVVDGMEAIHRIKEEK